jgi:hypothetical protein
VSGESRDLSEMKKVQAQKPAGAMVIGSGVLVGVNTKRGTERRPRDREQEILCAAQTVKMD